MVYAHFSTGVDTSTGSHVAGSHFKVRSNPMSETASKEWRRNRRSHSLRVYQANSQAQSVDLVIISTALSKDAYFSCPDHVAKEVIITKCYSVKKQPCLQCLSFFDPAEPDDSYFDVKSAMTKGQLVLQAVSWEGVN